MSWSTHFRRALARRLPRTRRAYHSTRIFLGNLRPGRLLATIRRLKPIISEISARRAETRLTVAVDISSFWEPLAGIGWYLFCILQQLASREDVKIRLYGPTVVHSSDLPAPMVTIPSGPAIEWVSYRVAEDRRYPAARTIQQLRKWEHLLIAADGNQVLFAPNYNLPRRFILARGAKVATIHDLGLRRVPWTLKEETLTILTDRLEHTIFEANRLITVSRSVRDELFAFGYSHPARVRVIHHGAGQLADVEPGELPPETPDRFALHVGTLEPRKNLGVLLAAWRLLRQLSEDCPVLLLCGRYGWKTVSIREEVEEGERQGWIRHLGYVGNDQLAALYGRASVVVFPTLYEGFGLPAVEALSAGAPLVCSDLPVLREVAGDAALFVPPDRPDLLARSLLRLLTDTELQTELIDRGKKRIRSFSWERAGLRTVATWYQAAGRPEPLWDGSRSGLLHDPPPSNGPRTPEGGTV